MEIFQLIKFARILILITIISSISGQVLINEFLASNLNYYQDEYGEYDEYENLKEVQDNYNDIETLEDLQNNTTVIEIPDSEKLIVQAY